MTALNVKNPEAHRLAREIAERAGVSLTDAVLVALREKRDGLATRDATPEARIEALLAYGRRFHVAGSDSSDTSELYDDELGLPK